MLKIIWLWPWSHDRRGLMTRHGALSLFRKALGRERRRRSELWRSWVAACLLCLPTDSKDKIR